MAPKADAQEAEVSEMRPALAAYRVGVISHTLARWAGIVARLERDSSPVGTLVEEVTDGWAASDDLSEFREFENCLSPLVLSHAVDVVVLAQLYRVTDRLREICTEQIKFKREAAGSYIPVGRPRLDSFETMGKMEVAELQGVVHTDAPNLPIRIAPFTEHEQLLPRVAELTSALIKPSHKARRWLCLGMAVGACWVTLHDCPGKLASEVDSLRSASETLASLGPHPWHGTLEDFFAAATDDDHARMKVKLGQANVAIRTALHGVTAEEPWLVINEQRGYIKYFGKEIPLADHNLKPLAALACNPMEPMTRDEICELTDGMAPCEKTLGEYLSRVSGQFKRVADEYERSRRDDKDVELMRQATIQKSSKRRGRREKRWALTIPEDRIDWAYD
jgi:hypothetical protein